MILVKEYRVEYAHRLPDHGGKCKNIHGHSGIVKVAFEGVVQEESGMVADFGHFSWLEELINNLDHSLLLKQDDPIVEVLANFGFRILLLSFPPTAEVLTQYLITNIQHLMVAQDIKGLKLQYVEFVETPGNAVCNFVEGS